MASAVSPTPPAPADWRIDVHYNNIVDAQFLHRVMDDPLRYVRGDGWLTTAQESAVPGKVLARADYHRAGRLELLVELEGAVVHLVMIDLALHVRVAGSSAEAVETALATLRQALPADEGEEERVPVSFWWWERNFPQEMGRRLPAPTAAEVELNYSARTWQQLHPMMSWANGPAPGGRMILWHGLPGTGKTTAVRTLARAWREWADFQFITDPERFLEISAYMLGTLSGRARIGSESANPQRWQVLVLEDSGEFLAPDAKHLTGQSVSRLLNLSDGALGHATRSLILITTNEHLQSLHPAVSRPGRCLAAVEFHELDRGEIDAWCSARGVEHPGVGRATVADLFAHAEERLPQRRDGGFGFATAA